MMCVIGASCREALLVGGKRLNNILHGRCRVHLLSLRKAFCMLGGRFYAMDCGGMVIGGISGGNG